MIKYYKGKILGKHRNIPFIVSVDEDYNVHYRKFINGPINETFKDTKEGFEYHTLKQCNCIEIDNGEELCSQFDALANSWKHMIDSYDKMFKHILE